MGRMMPMDCEHGVTVDWGDFGPCQNCDDHDGEECPNLERCALCEAERQNDEAIREAELEVIAAAIEWRRNVSLAGATDKHPAPRPYYSGNLADAVDHLRSLL